MNISPTAMRMFLQCPRKWAMRFIDRIVLDESLGPWRAQGDRMHAHLERARLGETLDLSDPEQRVASAAIPYWDPCPWQPEQWIRIERDGFAYRGKSDQFDPTGFVGDYKFTGNRANIPGHEPRMSDDVLAARAAWILRHDTQWIIYAGATKGPVCVGQWTYIIKPPRMQGEPVVLPVRWEEKREVIDRKLAALDDAARLMVAARREYDSANDVPHNARVACGGLGVPEKGYACDYARWCELVNPGKEIDLWQV